MHYSAFEAYNLITTYTQLLYCVASQSNVVDRFHALPSKPTHPKHLYQSIFLRYSNSAVELAVTNRSYVFLEAGL